LQPQRKREKKKSGAERNAGIKASVMRGLSGAAISCDLRQSSERTNEHNIPRKPFLQGKRLRSFKNFQELMISGELIGGASCDILTLPWK